jgi:hypothetical protein
MARGEIKKGWGSPAWIALVNLPKDVCLELCEIAGLDPDDDKALVLEMLSLVNGILSDHLVIADGRGGPRVKDVLAAVEHAENLARELRDALASLLETTDGYFAADPALMPKLAEFITAADESRAELEGSHNLSKWAEVRFTVSHLCKVFDQRANLCDESNPITLKIDFVTIAFNGAGIDCPKYFIADCCRKK